MWLKQSTAVTKKMGPFVDDTDGKTPETGLTIQKADVRLSKNGGDMAAANADQGESDAGAAHDELGLYDVSLDATDTATLGILRLDIQKSGALPVWEEFQVLPANVYDSLVGSDYLQVDVKQWKGATAPAMTGDAYAWLLAATGSTFNAIPWNAAWDAEVQSECSDALTAYDAATGADVLDVSVTFTPVAVTVSAGQVTDNAITQYQHAAFGPFLFTITDSDGAAVDLSSAGLTFAVYEPGTPGTLLWTLTSAAGDITVGGDSNNQVTVSDDDTHTGTAGVYRYVLWDTTADAVRARGTLTIEPEGSSAV